MAGISKGKIVKKIKEMVGYRRQARFGHRRPPIGGWGPPVDPNDLAGTLGRT